jgi:hypothetical protein
MGSVKKAALEGGNLTVAKGSEMTCSKCKKVKCECPGAKPVEVFKRYCAENPWALECRIYEI